MWKKITKSHGTGAPRQARTSFGVRKYRNGKGATAYLLIPNAKDYPPRFDVFSDGSGRIGFTFGDTGEFSLTKPKVGSTAQAIIPVKFMDRIPFGTADCEAGWEAGMLVLDLTQFNRISVAAE